MSESKFIKIEHAITMLLLAAIVVLVFAAAVMRTFGMPIIWSVDFAQLFFAWLCMLGANQALRNAEHVGVDMLVRRFHWQTRIKLDLLLMTLIIVGLICLFIFGAKLTLLNPQRALGTTSFSYSLVTLALPVGAILMLITASKLWMALLGLIGKTVDQIDFNTRYLPLYVVALSEPSQEVKAEDKA